jgi:serine/threonine kinase 16
MHRYRLPSVPFSSGSENDTGSSSYPPQPKLDVDTAFHDDLEPNMSDARSTNTLESAIPLIRSQLDDEDDEDNQVVFDGDEEMEAAESRTRDKGKGKAKETGDLIPYAHRDIKPG